MRKDLFKMNPQYNLGSYLKTALRINLGIGVTMGLVTFGGLLGPTYPLLGDSPFSKPGPVQKKTLQVSKPNNNSQLPEMGLSSNELVVLRDKTAQQEARIALLNNQINALNSQIRELNRTLFAKDHAIDNSKLRSLHQKLQAKNQSTSKLEDRIAALEGEIAEYKHKAQVNEVTIGSLSEMIALLKDNKEKVYAQHLDELHQMEVLAKAERQKLQEKLDSYNSDDTKWKLALKQKKDELKSKEEHFNQTLEEHNLSRQELENQIRSLNTEIEFLSVQLETERGRQKELRQEQNTWDKYSEELSQQLTALNETHDKVQEALLKVSKNAVAIDEDHEIYHVLQTYQHHNDVSEHKRAHALITDQHETLQTVLQQTLNAKQADLKLHAQLENKIRALQQELAKANETITSLRSEDENTLMKIARVGAEREDELQAQQLLDAFREREIRKEYDGIDDKLAYEQDQRKLLQTHLINLSLASDDRENEISDWIKNWEILVVKAELERDAALAKLELYIHGQDEVAEQLKRINAKYAELEGLLQLETLNHQNQLTEMEEQLAIYKEEAAHQKLDASLTQLTHMLEKKESEDKFTNLMTLESIDKEIVNALETERDEAFKSLAFAEERQNELLTQVNELSEKYARLESEYKQHHETANSNEDNFAQQIQDLEALTQKLHDALESEKTTFAKHKEEAEKQQVELTRLYEEAKNKSLALEQDLAATIARHSDESNETILNLEFEREQAFKNLETAEAKKAELQDQYNELTQKHTQLEKEHADVRLQHSEANESASNLAFERDQALKNANTLETRNAEIQAQFEELTHKYAQLQDEFHHTKTAHSNEIEESFNNFQTEREQVLRSLSAAEEKQNDLLKQLDQLSDKYATLETDFKAKEQSSKESHEGYLNQIQELENLTQELKHELSNERDALAKYRHEIEQHQSKVNELVEAVNNLEKERDDAQSKLSIAEAQQILITEELENLSKKYDQVQRDFQSHSQKAVQSSTEFHDQLLLLEAHTKTLEEELRKEKQLAYDKVQDHDRFIAALEDEREAALQKAQVTDQQKEEALSGLNSLRNKVIQLENQLTQESANAQNVIQQLENQLENARAELDALHGTMMTSQDHYSEKEQKFLDREKNYQEKINALEKDMTDLQKFLDEERVRWDALEKELQQN